MKKAAETPEKIGDFTHASHLAPTSMAAPNGSGSHSHHTMKTEFSKPKSIAGSKPAALANDQLSDEGYRLALDNEGELDADGWALIAPFWEHPKTRVFREGGQVKEQQFLQVLDNDSADAMMAKENSFFRTLRRALVGIPVYKGHGDLNEADPQAVANETRKIKLGGVDRIRILSGYLPEENGTGR
jgi:hypothetical protein